MTIQVQENHHEQGVSGPGTRKRVDGHWEMDLSMLLLWFVFPFCFDCIFMRSDVFALFLDRLGDGRT